MNLFEIFNVARKAVNNMLFPSGGVSLLTMPRSSYRYSKDVNGYQSAIIMACVGWIQRTYPEAPLYLRQRAADGSWEDIYDHELLKLVDTPNPYYDGVLLQQATVADYNIDGNAYWRKIRSGAKRVVELWWIPSTLIEPKWGTSYGSSSVYISHYEYSVGGTPEKVDPADIIHFRNGLDPQNMRKGLAPLKSLFREIFTDDEAANMTAALLKNMGIPGVVFSPKDTTVAFSKEQKEEMTDRLKEKFVGDKRGEPIVMTGPTTIEQFGFSPQQMDMKALRRIPEERISAVLGVPAIVAGLGAGLDRSTYANMAEAREMAYENNIIPTQRIHGSVIRRQLLSDFMDDITNWQVAYDLSEVRVLQEDENKKALRIGTMVKDGFITVADAQKETRMPVDETQHLYLRPMNIMEVPATSIKSKNFKASLPEENKEAMWRSYIAKTEGQEGAFKKAFKLLLDEQEKEVIGKLKGAKKPEDAMFDTSEANKSFVKKFKPLITDVFEHSAALVMIEDLEPPHKDMKQELPLDAEAIEWIETRSLESAKLVNGTTKEMLRKELAEGFKEGESVPKLTKRIKTFYDGTHKGRANMVARTETIAASNEGALWRYDKEGIETYEWYCALDERSCDDCTALHGRIYPMGQGEVPPLHTNCRCVVLPIIG